MVTSWCLWWRCSLHYSRALYHVCVLWDRSYLHVALCLEGGEHQHKGQAQHPNVYGGAVHWHLHLGGIRGSSLYSTVDGVDAAQHRSGIRLLRWWLGDASSATGICVTNSTDTLLFLSARNSLREWGERGGLVRCGALGTGADKTAQHWTKTSCIHNKKYTPCICKINSTSRWPNLHELPRK